MSQFNLRFVDFDDIKEIRRFNQAFIHPSGYGAGYMANKASFLNIYAENLRDPAVQILKESALSCGCELVTNRDVLIHKCGTSAVLLLADKARLKKLILRLKLQQFGLSEFGAELEELLDTVIL